MNILGYFKDKVLFMIDKMANYIYHHYMYHIRKATLPSRFKYFHELENNQWLSPKDIKELQWHRVEKIIKHSYENVPYYRTLFDQIGINLKDIQTPEDFRKIPILTKNDIRNNFSQLLATGYDPKDLELSATGGSTGEPVRYYHDSNYKAYQSASTARVYNWVTGYHRGDCEFKVWGSDIDIKHAVSSRSIKKFIKNAIHPVIFYPAFQMSQTMICQFIDDIWKKKPSIIAGYTTPLVFIGDYIIKHNINLSKAGIKGVISGSETLFPYQRRILEQAFYCKVHNYYGSREMGNVVFECGKGELHVFDDIIYLEVIGGNGEPSKENEIGMIVLTCLTNFCMPFIRYQIEDIAIPESGACICGRGLSSISAIEGRVQDMIILKEGKFLAGEFFPHFFKDFDIKKFQVVQESLELLNIYIVRGKNLYDDNIVYIREKISEYTGIEQINMHFVDSIPTSPSGKFRFTISKLKNPYYV